MSNWTFTKIPQNLAAKLQKSANVSTFLRVHFTNIEPKSVAVRNKIPIVNLAVHWRRLTSTGRTNSVSTAFWHGNSSLSGLTKFSCLGNEKVSNKDLKNNRNIDCFDKHAYNHQWSQIVQNNSSSVKSWPLVHHWVAPASEQLKNLQRKVNSYWPFSRFVYYLETGPSTILLHKSKDKAQKVTIGVLFLTAPNIVDFGTMLVKCTLKESAS